MKKLTAVLACFIVLVTTQTSSSQSNSASWTGVWQGTLEGLPGTILTLSNDSGKLGGTVVFNGLSRETHTIAATETHLLLHPRLDGNTLTFQIKKHGNEMETGTHNFTLVLTPAVKLQFHCTDCGPGSPTTELTRMQWTQTINPSR